MKIKYTKALMTPSIKLRCHQARRVSQFVESDKFLQLGTNLQSHPQNTSSPADLQIDIARNDQIDLISLGTFDQMSNDDSEKITIKQITIDDFFADSFINVEEGSVNQSSEIETQDTGNSESPSQRMDSEMGASKSPFEHLDQDSAESFQNLSGKKESVKSSSRKIRKERSQEFSSSTASIFSGVTTALSQEQKPRIITAAGSRKCKEILKLLIANYYRYGGPFRGDEFKDLMLETGFNKKQLNKWFWDRRQKELREIQYKKLKHPGLLFQINNIKTGQDLTPDSLTFFSLPIFKLEKKEKK